MPKDVYRRHQRCRCSVEYYPRDGKIQNVHTKKWRNTDGKVKRKTLDSQLEKRYNNSPAKKLKEMYDESVSSGMMTPLCSFTEYMVLYRQLEREVVGKQTVSGIVITEISQHFMERIVGTSLDPQIYKDEHRKQSRSGVKLEEIKEALFRGKYRPPMINGHDLSQLFYTEKCKVTVNPNTGKLIQCNEQRQK